MYKGGVPLDMRAKRRQNVRCKLGGGVHPRKSGKIDFQIMVVGLRHRQCACLRSEFGHARQKWRAWHRMLWWHKMEPVFGTKSNNLDIILLENGLCTEAKVYFL